VPVSSLPRGSTEPVTPGRALAGCTSVEILRQSLDERDGIAVYERDSRGEVDEETARVLLGEKIDRMERERASFEAATERDTSEFLTDSE